MKFTDRFIRVSIQVEDTTQKELTGSSEPMDSWEMIDPQEIATYRPRYDDSDGIDGTIILFKNAIVLSTSTKYNEFETLLNNWQPEALYLKQ